MRGDSSTTQDQASPRRTPILELRKVSCAYETGRPAIVDISLCVLEGEILCLLGPSGCGKTTTLRAIAGFEPVINGEIVLGDRLVSSPTAFVPTEERHIGMVFQEYALFPHLRVMENITFGLNHLTREAQRAEADRLLQLTGLTGLDRRYPHELSGGQQQRVALARALAQKPVLLLLDEPFSNLDPDMRGKMREDLRRLLRETHMTAVLVTHDHEEAFAMADRIAVLNQGRVEQVDTPEAIYHTPSSPFVADFVGQADFIPGTVQNGTVLTELGTFPNEGDYPVGMQVVVLIRPDDVHIMPSKEGLGRIVSRQFRGSENYYRIQLPSGRPVHSTESSTSIYPIGTTVQVRVLASHTVLFEKRLVQPPPTGTNEP